MITILGLGIAIFGVISGLSWQFVNWARSTDLAYFHKINSEQLWNGVDRLVAIVRWLGTKWALMLYLGIILFWDFQLGLLLIVAALFTTAIESGIKRIVKRPRPFTVSSSSILRQNPIPRDSSFPSGDATRIWFIFATLMIGLSPAFGIMFIAGLCAVFVSYGRVRLGVHYPLDVWAGSTLGFGMGLVWAVLSS
jgi:undecaprenyl-diphosphatase